MVYITDPAAVLGAYSKDVNKTVKTLIGEKSEEILRRMQK